MYLKRIKIFGFKSFAEESIFDFDKGITAVVGPNGCGKSNLLDAVNWVLGEQSAGRLRGNEMQDMIFKGSRTRKPLGVARVELMLDNSRNILPIDYDEVSVSRKLYRSGESEYFINKNPCRMKDIKELFLDTGIGTRSYSIMEQDNIKFILESSPVERRGILEEAAGIRKYKEKKLESERRLERIKDDLKEVKNIMAEVQKNIRKLRIQKNKAKKYRELKNRLRYFEVSRLCQEYTSIIKILNTKEKDSSELQKDIARVGSEKGKLEVEISELENKKTKMEEELLDKNHKVYKIESRMEILNSRIDDFDSSQERLNEEIQRLNKTLDFNKEKINKLAGEIERLEKTGDKRKQEELEELELKNDSLSQKKENFNARISELRRKIESDEKRLFHLKKKEVELINKKKNATQKSDELGNRKRELDKLIQEFGRKLDGKNTRLNNIQKEIDNIDEKRNNCKQEIKELDHKVIDLNKQREKLLKFFHKKESEFESSKKYLPQLVSIDEIFKNKIKGITGPVSSIVEKEIGKGEHKKISRLLGDKSGWMLAEDKKAAEQTIKYLEEKNLPPLTFILKNKVPRTKVDLELPERIDNELKKIIRYLIRGTKQDRGIVWRDSCVLTGGGVSPSTSWHILGLESDIENIKKQLSRCEKEIKSSKDRRMKRSDELNSLTKRIDRLNKEMISVKESADQLTGNYEYIKNELESIDSRYRNMENESGIEEDIQQKTKEINRIEKNLSQDKKIYRDKLKQSEELAVEIAGLQIKISNIKNEVQDKLRNLNESQKRKEHLIEENASIKEMIDDLESKKEFRYKQNEKDLREIDELEDSKKEVLKNIGEMEEDKGRCFRRLSELKKKHRMLSEQMDRTKDKLGEHKQSEERFKERVQNIQVRLKEDMNTELEDALEDYSKDKIEDEQIFQLKEKINRIGQVNLGAPEEFDKEYQRFEFIKNHVDDLEKADKDLKNIIKKINSETKGRFLETFNEVNKNFKKIFVKLFEGGDAKLILTEPDNILESGIEIKARPQGKNLTSVKLISGGESALCAISLMFAIYEVKPTPFCILDEVDSPLDDTNLHRFLRMLRDYTDSTQFIIITHNKQTMQMCDTFYGITMEEFGVSKIISIKLRKAQKVSGP